MKNQDILDSIPALNELGQMTLPVRSAFAISRTLRRVKEVSEDIESARRQLIERHAKRDVTGRMLYAKFPNGEDDQTRVELINVATFKAAMDELLSLEVADFTVTPIKLADLGDIAARPATLAVLWWLVIEGTPGASGEA